MALGAAETVPDVIVKSDYGAMIRATQAARQGKAAPSPVATEGDTAALAQLVQILTAARAAATVDVEFPAA